MLKKINFYLTFLVFIINKYKMKCFVFKTLVLTLCFCFYLCNTHEKLTELNFITNSEFFQIEINKTLNCSINSFIPDNFFAYKIVFNFYSLTENISDYFAKYEILKGNYIVQKSKPCYLKTI